jgi:hypothetical protein
MKYRAFFPILLAIIVAFPTLAAAQKMTAEEVITKHLDSIAPADKRAAHKSFMAVGEVGIEYITQKSQPAGGRAIIASDGKTFFFGMNLNASDYAQEKIVFNGSKTSVAFVRPGSRSPLGTFLNSSPELISQGIFGGVLSTNWTLLSEDARSRFSYSGTKKVAGSEAHALRFNPKGGSDLDITLYFDAKTFQHVRTEYKRTSSASIGATIDQSARQNETRISLTEDFSVFRDIQGMMLPHQHKVLYVTSGTRGTNEISWTSQFTEFVPNPKLDPGTFNTER